MDELKEKFIELTKKIRNGYVMSDYEKQEYIRVYSFLFSMGYYFIKDQDIIREIGSESRDYSSFQAQKFYDEIGDLLSEVILNFEFDSEMLEKKEIYEYYKMKNEILKFYNHFDHSHYSLVKEILEEHGRLNIVDFAFKDSKEDNTQNGAALFFNEKGYILVETGKNNSIPFYIKYDISTPNIIAHELGHIISGMYRQEHQSTESTCNELIPEIANLSYAKTHKNKVEAAKILLEAKESLKDYILVVNSECKKSEKDIAYIYILAHSIGEYLSHLYATNIFAFRKYFNFIKDNIYVNDDKIVELFLNDTKFRNMEYLKNDIEKSKKILLKK